MAEPVIVPIQLEVQDIELEFNAAEINKELSERLSGVRKTVNNILSSVDPSTMNKAISKSMKAIEADVARVEVAQRQFGRTVTTVGKSTQGYKDALKDLEAEQKKLDDIKGMKAVFEDDQGKPRSDLNAGMKKSYAELSKEYSAQMNKVRRMENEATPENFAWTGSDADIERIAVAYTRVMNAVKQLNSAQENYNKTIEENKGTDEYKEMVTQAEAYKKKLQDLNNKSKKMEALGATDRQWEELRYDTEKVSTEFDTLIKKMRTAVTTGEAFRFGNGSKQDLSRQINSFAMSKQNLAGNVQGRAKKSESPYTKEYQSALDELDKLEKKITSVKEKSDKMIELGASDKQFQSLAYDAEQLESKVDGVKNRLMEMVNNGSAFKFNTGNAETEIGKIQERSNGLQNSLSNVVTGAKKAQGGLTALGATHPKLAAVLRVAEGIAVGFGKVMKGAVIAGSAIAKGFSSGAKVIQKVASAVSKVTKSFANVGKRVVGAIKNITKFGKSGRSTSTDLDKRFKKLGRSILMFGFGFRTAYYAIKRLRTIFTESFKAMGKSFDEVGKPMATMIESFNRLKGSLATAFQPIVSVVMPILTRLMNYLSSMLEAIGKFNAALTGQGHIYKAVAKNIDSTTMSAKEAKKELGSYDKLEVIQNDSGGGSDDLGYSYEKQEIDATGAAANFAKMVKDAWEKADFTSVGTFVTEKLLAVLDSIEKNLLPKVTGFVNRLLKSINTFLASFGSFDIGGKVSSLINTLVTGVDWSQVGALFGNITNTIWGFLDGLANGINWANLGQSLATGISSLFSTVKLEHFVGAISGWVNGITTALYNMITNIDWASIGQQFGTAVNNLFTKIDFAQVGTTIKTALDGIWTVIGNFFATADWAAIGKQVSKGINSIFKGNSAFKSAIPNVVSGLVKFLETCIVSIDWGAIANTLWTGLEALLSALATSFQSSENPFFQMIGGVFGAIQQALTALKPAVDAILPALIEIVTAVLPVITELMPPIASIISDVIVSVLPVITSLLNALMPILIQLIQIVLPILQSILTALQPVFDVIINTVLPVVVKLLDSLMPIIERILDVVTALLVPIVELLAPLIELVFNILDPIITILTPILDLITLLVEIIGFVLTPILEALSPIISIISSVFNVLGSVIQTIINVAIQPIVDIIKFLAEAIMYILKPAIEVIMGIFNVLCGIVELVLDAFSLMWDGIAAGAEAVWSIIKTPLNLLLAGLEAITNGVISGLNFLIRALNKISFDIPDWVPVIGGKKFGFNIKEIKQISIPRLAQGAVIPPNKEFLAMLGDQKHGTNIEAPLDTIKQALAEVLAEVGGGSREPIVLQVNGRTLAQVVWDEQTKRYKQTGKYAPAY